MGRASQLQDAQKLSPPDSAAIANALVHLRPPELRLAGHLVQAALSLPTDTARRPPPPPPTPVLLHLAECHAAATRHAADRAKPASTPPNPAVAAAAAHVADGLCRSAHMLTIPELTRALCAMGGLPITTSLRRRFAHAALCSVSGAAITKRCTVHQCVDLLTALQCLGLPPGDAVADEGADALVRQSVSLRASPASAAAMLRALGALQFSARTDGRARSVSAFCERVRRPWTPPPLPEMRLDALRGLAGIRTSWQSALKTRRAAQLISALLPVLGELPAEALADAAVAVGRLTVATHVRATFLVALEAQLPQEQLERLPPHMHVRLLQGLSKIASASTPFHVEAGRASRQMADVPAPEEVSPQPPSAALCVLVERIAPCVKPHALSAAQLTEAVEALARLEAAPSQVSPLLYAAVGAAEGGFRSLDATSTSRLIHGLSYFANVRFSSCSLKVVSGRLLRGGSRAAALCSGTWAERGRRGGTPTCAAGGAATGVVFRGAGQSSRCVRAVLECGAGRADLHSLAAARELCAARVGAAAGCTRVCGHGPRGTAAARPRALRGPAARKGGVEAVAGRAGGDWVL